MVFPVVGGNQSTGDFITNSLRFDRASSAAMSISSLSGGSTTKVTVSAWIKRSGLGTDQRYWANYAGSASDRLQFGWQTDDKLYIQHGDSVIFRTNQVFRDVSAWYHIVIAIDSTQGSNDNRVKAYLNGSQITSWGTFNTLTQNTEIFANNDKIIIGERETSDLFYDGYLSHLIQVDGSQLAPTQFGETNDNGVWVPIEYTGSFGTNGFKLEFKQTGTSANASGIGADTSGNGKHFTLSNLAAIDVVTDTPFNNFCTFNPLDVSGVDNPGEVCTFSEGNTKAVQGNSNNVVGWAASTIGIRNGKWYFEIKLPTVGYQVFGIGPESWDGQDNALANVFMVYVDNGSATFRTGASGGQGSFSFSESNNDIWMFALDLDTPKLWFGVNGSWYNSGDPSAGSNPTSTQAITDTVFIKGSLYTQNRELLLNTGQPAFSISSGNADANGHGNFEYAPPSGFLSICTKNLAETG